MDNDKTSGLSLVSIEETGKVQERNYVPGGIKTVESNSAEEFESEVNLLLYQGYKIVSSFCGMVPKVTGYSTPKWMATLIVEDDYIMGS